MTEKSEAIKSAVVELIPTNKRSYVAVEIGTLPKCVSDWTGSDYSALTLNCNTYTSTVLKCVYGLSDAKPHLGVSDMVNVKCPVEKTLDGNEVEACLVPSTEEVFPDQNGELSME